MDKVEERVESRVFGELAANLVGNGLGFRFRAKGRSMLPTIQDGEFLHIQPANAAKLKVGDIVLFKDGAEFKAHRIVGKLPGTDVFKARGDSGEQADSIRGGQIVGKIVARECAKTGGVVSLEGRGARLRFFAAEARRRLSQRVPSMLPALTLFVFFSLLATVEVRAQIVVDTVSTGTQTVNGAAGAFTFSFSHTTTAGGTNRLLVVGVSINATANTNSTITGITYGVQTLTKTLASGGTAANPMRVEMWYLVAPATGTASVSVTGNKSGGNKLGVVAGAITFTGTYQVSPIRSSASNLGTSNTAQVTVASSGGDVVLDTLAVVEGTSVTTGASQTSRWNTSSGGTGQDAVGTGSTSAGAASVTMTEGLSASTAWTLGAISIRANQSDVAITKSGSPNPVLQGQTLTYTLVVTNHGPLDATGVVAQDTLPTQVSFVSASTTTGICLQAAGVVDCNIGSMSVGATATITIVTTAVTPSLATNTATVTSVTLDAYQANNTATITTLIEFPNAVRMNSFSATQTGSGVLLSWKTGGELHNLGFNVYRDAGGEKVRLNPALIAGSALLMREALEQHGAKTYGWIDHSPASNGLYWLEDVDLNGTRTIDGPVSVQSVAAATQAMIRATTIQDLAQASSAQSMTSSTGNAEGHVRETLARPRASAATQDVGFQLAARSAVKIFVDHEGWYRVTQPQLVAAGLDPNAEARSLHLFAEGVEQPIRITGAGFGPQAAIEFYGTAIDTPYSGQRVYWLVTNNQPGKRIPDVSEGSAGPEPQSFMQTLQLKPRTTYFAALLRDNTDNFFGPLVSPTSAIQTVNVSNLATGEGTLQIVLQGVTQGQQHDVTVAVNGATLGDVNFSGQQEGKAGLAVPAGILTNGANTITLSAQQGANDLSMVDYIDVSFPHTFTAESDLLKFTADAGESVTVAGFLHPPTRLVDITNPVQPFEVAYRTSTQSGSYALQASVPWTVPGAHTLLALSDAQLASPVAMVTHHPSNLHRPQSGAEVVVLTAPQFAAQIQPLAALHKAEGKSVALVSVDDVYDEFNFGERTPYAIRNFLSTATATWKNKPHYLLLAGDASVDPRDYLGFGFFDFMPTKVVVTAELKTASDDWFSDFDNTGFAKIATGRLPARTTADAQTMVGKIVNYANGQAASWTNQSLMVADLDDPTVNFSQAAQSVQKMLPQSMNVTDVFASTVGPATAKQDILASINAGQLLVNYNGHGSVEIWSGSDLFDDTTASSLTNGNELPVFVIMNCLNGFFHDVMTESLAESLMLARNGGAVAVWASSGLTAPDPQFQMDQTLMKTLFSQPSIALGDAVLFAKSGIGDQDVRKTFILFGDPLMRLKTPGGLTQITNHTTQTNNQPQPSAPSGAKLEKDNR